MTKPKFKEGQKVTVRIGRERFTSEIEWAEKEEMKWSAPEWTYGVTDADGESRWCREDQIS